MFVKLRHESHAVFPNDPSRLVAVFVIFKSMVDRNSGHPDIHARLQRIAFGIKAQDRRMLRDRVFEQDHINVVMKVLFLLTRWLLPFQFAGNKSVDTFESPASLCKSRITTRTDLDGRLSSIANTKDSSEMFWLKL
jgi:hypothetical protein